MIQGEYPILTSSSSQDHSGSFVMCCDVLHQVITVYGSRNSPGNVTTVSVKFIRVKRDKCLEQYDIKIIISSANVQSCAQKQKSYNKGDFLKQKYELDTFCLSKLL